MRLHPVSVDSAVKNDRKTNAVGIIDIGSNSVRFVVFEGQSRAPVQMFNEKSACALGANIQQTGKLDPAGREKAVSAVGRFVRLAKAMDVGSISLLATAAVRDAKDGPDFVKELIARYGEPVQVLSGDDEARLAAYGVLCGTPSINGIVADLGGGSLELAEADGERKKILGDMCSFPLGVLRLEDMEASGADVLSQSITKHFSQQPWLKASHPKNLYAVGGAWRALAKLCMHQENHPLQILDQYTLPLERALELTSVVARQGRRSLDKLPGVSRRRLVTLPLAAKLMHALLGEVRPKVLVFSVHGMREGFYYTQLSNRIRRHDPLEDMCRTIAGNGHRFSQQPAKLMHFLDPLFTGESSKEYRQRYAACMLGDLYWDEHPDYRGQQAFFKTLRLPVVGFDHEDRAALALMVLYRYQSYDGIHDAQNAMALLHPIDRTRVAAVGFALRLAHAMTGGAPGILQHCSLVCDDKRLTLRVPADEVALEGQGYYKRLDQLARCLELFPVVERV